MDLNDSVKTTTWQFKDIVICIREIRKMPKKFLVVFSKCKNLKLIEHLSFLSLSINL